MRSTEELSRKGAKAQSATAFLRVFFAPLRLCARKRVSQALLLIIFFGLNVFSQIQPAEFEELATTLVTLKSAQERESLLSKKRDLMTPDLRKALIRQGNTRLLAGQYATAFDIYGLAQNIAEKIGD